MNVFFIFFMSIYWSKHGLDGSFLKAKVSEMQFQQPTEWSPVRQSI